MEELLLEIEHRSRKDGVRVVSRETGRLLSVLVTAMQASRILEVGTGYGEATLRMALAQPRMGKIWTIDGEMHHTEVARMYFARTGEDDYIEVLNTPPLELLENFPHRNLDIAFVSANAAEYGEYLELLIPMLKLSGLAIFACCGEDTPGMREFAQRFLAHPSLDATILSIGEGTAIGARLIVIEAEPFKQAMRHVPTGVTVVTSLRDGEPRGITVNAFASVSLEPPSLLICVNREARSYLFIATSRIFCVNVLAGDQRRLAEHFSGKVRERQFAGVAYRIDATGAPVLEGAVAHFDCTLAQEYQVGSHSILIGRVLSCAARPGSPLGYFNGGFHDFGIHVD